MEKKQDFSLQGPGVLEKYKVAGTVAQTVMKELVELCVVDADIHELCKKGDERIVEELNKVYTSKKFPKGIAFPVCISPNEICGHYSPFKEDSKKLKEGDMIKIDLGVQIDDYPVVLAHTMIVGKTDDELKLKIVSAAYHALTTAIKCMNVENDNYECTKAIEQVCKVFEVSPMEGVISHELERDIIDGDRVIQTVSDASNRVDTFKFEKNQIFGLDVIVSGNSEEAKSKESELRVTVYKKNQDINVDLKSKRARAFLSEARSRFGNFAFSLNNFEDPMEARIGVSECHKTQHLQAYHVLEEKSKNLVAQYKWTVALSGKRLLILAGLQELNFELLDLPKLDDEKLQKLAETPLVDFTSKKKRPKKK